MFNLGAIAGLPALMIITRDLWQSRVNIIEKTERIVRDWSFLALSLGSIFIKCTIRQAQENLDLLPAGNQFEIASFELLQMKTLLLGLSVIQFGGFMIEEGRHRAPLCNSRIQRKMYGIASTVFVFTVPLCNATSLLTWVLRDPQILVDPYGIGEGLNTMAIIVRMLSIDLRTRPSVISRLVWYRRPVGRGLGG